MSKSQLKKDGFVLKQLPEEKLIEVLQRHKGALAW